MLYYMENLRRVQGFTLHDFSLFMLVLASTPCLQSHYTDLLRLYGKDEDELTRCLHPGAYRHGEKKGDVCLVEV